MIIVLWSPADFLNDYTVIIQLNLLWNFTHIDEIGDVVRKIFV